MTACVGKPVVRVEREASRHDGLDRDGDVAAHRAQRGRRRGQAGQRRLHVVAAAERRSAGEHLEQEEAERVDVGAGVDRLRLHLLGREVPRGADDRAGSRQVAPALGLRDAEVGDLDGPDVGDEHVRGLDVAMDDAVAVRMVERRGHAACDAHGLIDPEGARAGRAWPAGSALRPAP